MELSEKGVYLVNGTDIVPDTEEASARIRQMTGKEPDRQQARRETMAWSILHSHNLSGDDEKLQIRFDKMASHDITYVGIIQTRPGAVSDSVCPDELPQFALCCRRYDQ